jgi:putative ABC transport system substrate-binding protein
MAAGESEQMIGRRTALALGLSVALLSASLGVEAQPARKMPRIGWLGVPGQAGNADFIRGFRDGLRQLGYEEGKDINLEYRFADGRAERLPTLALELVNLHVDAIVVIGGQAATAAKHATTTIPIVMVSVGDPVETGLVASLAKPGGNVTGLSAAHGDMAAKWLDLLREVVPKASRFGYLEDPNTPMSQILFREILGAGRIRGVSVQVFAVNTPDEVETQLSAMTQARVQAVVVGPTPVPRTRQKEIVAFAARSRLPAMYGGRDYVDAGGLMSYNPSRPDMGRQGARYIDKILRGAKPADLPVETPTKVELVINMKAARAMGLTIPPSVLMRADQVIE